ncbi:MAG: DUF58 domain-containing protein [Candidatus Thermoplasmatota archaeon]|nr:DUF58 domain-containing protein [Candidatus Thermoplasmatota archaeon]
MQSTPLGTVIISLSIAFGLVSVLFSNISWAVVSVAMIAVYVYAHRVFVSELEETDLELQRTVLDDLAFAGEPVAVRVELLNKHPSAIRGTFEDVIPGDASLGDGSNRSSLPIPPRSILRLSYSIVPRRRGTTIIPGMRMSRIDGFGMLMEEQFMEKPSAINVHTQKESLNKARRMAGREHLEFSGTGRNPAVVLRELEFDGIREYVPGDRARDIHWKLLPKLGKLMTKTYRKEGAVHTTVFIDCGRSMRLKAGKVAKIDHALDLSIQLSNVLLSGFNPAGVAAFDEVRIIERVPPGLGRRQFEKIVNALRSVPGAKGEPETMSRPATGQGNSSAKGKRSGGNGVLAAEDSGFLSTVDTLQTGTKRRPMGLGLEGGMKEIVARSRGQEHMFIVITDLISSRDAVLAGAKLCQDTGNKMMVINTYDEWYREPSAGLDLPEADRLYEDLKGSLNIEGKLRGLSAKFIRIGPADAASRIVRTIRRGKA